MTIAVIDNYDSFTYNLVHYLEEFGVRVTVFRNDMFALEDIKNFDKILLSPGPGLPDEAGLLKDVIKTFYSSKSILGVCLGMQAIGEVFGGRLINLSKVYHGVATNITIIAEDNLYNHLPNAFVVGRYHSWVVSKDGFPDDLMITSVDEDWQIMSLKHRVYDVKGVQFHPESVLTPHGKQLIKNWITDEGNTQ